MRAKDRQLERYGFSADDGGLQMMTEVICFLLCFQFLTAPLFGILLENVLEFQMSNHSFGIFQIRIDRL